MSLPSTPPPLLRPSSPSWISFSPDVIPSPYHDAPSPNNQQRPPPSPTKKSPSKYSRPRPPVYRVAVPTPIPKIGLPPTGKRGSRRRSPVRVEVEVDDPDSPGQETFFHPGPERKSKGSNDLDSLVFADRFSTLLLSPVVDTPSVYAVSPTTSEAPSQLSTTSSTPSDGPKTPTEVDIHFPTKSSATDSSTVTPIRVQIDDSDTLEILSSDPLVTHFSSSLTSSSSSSHHTNNINSFDDESQWDDFYASLTSSSNQSRHFPLTPYAQKTPTTKTSKHPYGYSSPSSPYMRSRRGSTVSAYSRKSSISVIIPSYSYGSTVTSTSNNNFNNNTNTNNPNANKSPRKVPSVTPLSPAVSIRRTKSRGRLVPPVSRPFGRFTSTRSSPSHKTSTVEKERKKKEKEIARQLKYERDRMPIKTKEGLNVDALDLFFGVTPEMGKAMRSGYSGFGVESKKGWKRTEGFESLLRNEGGGADEEEEEVVVAVQDSRAGKGLDGGRALQSGWEPTVKKSNSFKRRPPPLDLSKTRPRSASMSTNSADLEFETPPSSAKTVATSPYILSPDPLTKEVRRRASEAILSSRNAGKGKEGRAEGAGGKASLGERLREFWQSMQKD